LINEDRDQDDHHLKTASTYYMLNIKPTILTAKSKCQKIRKLI